MTGPVRSLLDAPDSRTAIAPTPSSPAITYGELVSSALGRAAELRRRNAGTILLVAENSPDYIAWFLGSLWAGCWAMVVQGAAPRSDLASLADRLAAGLIIGRDLPGLPSLPLRADFPPAPAAGPEGGLMLQSSGTTGMPKIVRRNAKSLRAVARNVADAVGLTPNDVVGAAIPMGHSYGIENALLAPLAAGASIRVFASFEPAAIASHLTGITVFPGVPFFFEAISRATANRGSLRLAYSAGASLPARTAAAFQDAFGLRLGQLFGTTEVGSVAFAHPDDPAFDPASVGKPMHGVRIRIADGDGRDLPRGAEGQVLIAAPSMLESYADAPLDLTPDGFFPTGDLGRLDETGQLSITGRLKFIVDVGGLKVNPLEVEAVLASHPRVADCIVLPLSLSETVTRLRALVVPRAAIDLESLRDFCRARLAPHKVPRVFEVRDDLPRSPTGKILRRQLLEAR